MKKLKNQKKLKEDLKNHKQFKLNIPENWFRGG